MWVFRLRSSGIECATGPCSSDRDGATQGGDFHIDGSAKGPKFDADFPAVSAFEKTGILGQSFLVQGLLCRHGGFGCGHDTQVCPLPGKKGAVNGTVAADRLGNITAAQLPRPAPYWGQGFVPPMGGFFKATPSGCGSLLTQPQE